jgi:hypothetical protein
MSIIFYVRVYRTERLNILVHNEKISSEPASRLDGFVSFNYKRRKNMNIYLVIEDGEQFCIKANTMSEATCICERSYLDDREEHESPIDVDVERKYYQEQILQSCSLVGVLKN